MLTSLFYCSGGDGSAFCCRPSTFLFYIVQRQFVGDFIDELGSQTVFLGIAADGVFQFIKRNRVVLEILSFQNFRPRIDENKNWMDFFFREINIPADEIIADR